VEKTRASKIKRSKFNSDASLIKPLQEDDEMSFFLPIGIPPGSFLFYQYALLVTG
jgi:hypothetical protein